MTEKKKTNPLVFVGIGCLALLVLGGIGTTVVLKFVANKAKTALQEGKMTFTDPKTGTTVNMGTSEIPDNFPKDFPVYPGATVTSSLSGGQSGQGNGFWLTLATGDSLDAVTTFYENAFASSGWTVESTYTANGTATQTVKKGSMSGSISIGRDDSAQDTQIVIVLGEQSN